MRPFLIVETGTYRGGSARYFASLCDLLGYGKVPHHGPHVRAELDTYHRFIMAGNHLIVEDTNINGHPVRPSIGPGPMEAVASFLPRHPEFVVDRSRERYLVTHNPGGYLRRRAS